MMSNIEQALRTAIVNFEAMSSYCDTKEVLNQCKSALSEIGECEPVANHNEAVSHLWESIGRWSAYIASNGEQAELSPPSWLIDAVRKATSPQPIEKREPVAEALHERNNMNIGGKYNWRNQTERLFYIGKQGSWHQFVKVDKPDVVWCEVLDADLHMIEETKGE